MSFLETSQAFILSYEGLLRLGVFLGLLIGLALLEGYFPRRSRIHSQSSRWFSNLGLSVIASLCLRCLVTLPPVLLALWLETRGWGFFHQVDLPFIAECLLSILLLDLSVYGQHVAFHRIPFLWRMHRVHHTDQDLDVSSAVRFHPLESMVSMAFKLLCLVLLGAPVVAVFCFEVLLNGMAMFNHANLRLPKKLDLFLRLGLVTPDMHRVHHSVIVTETNSNYGFNLSCWDRLFRTYRSQPEKGHEAMPLGLQEFLQEQPHSLKFLLWMPLRPMVK